MEPISLAWVAEQIDASVIGDAQGFVTEVCTDTRKIAPGSLFFALSGERFDGHSFVRQALDAGAIAAVVARNIEDVTGPLLVVPDPLQALGDLAMRYRQQYPICVVGITGSVGKTSTKEMVAAVLRRRYNTLAGEKNYNNEIGVPLTLFRLDRSFEAAVVEMGMRGLGQIDRLAEIARPTLGLITNIGYAHLEMLGSRENIARAKAELIARLPEDGVAILPEHDAFFLELRARVPKGCRLATFSAEPSSTADVCIENLETAYLSGREDNTSGGDSSVRVRVANRRYPLNLKVVGTHHARNAVAALAVAYTLDVPIQEAITALENWEGAPERMTLRYTEAGGIVLDDCYNASLESVEEAIKTLVALTRSRPGAAVLGDMRELGEFTQEAHRRVGIQIGESDIRTLVTVGELAQMIAVIAFTERRATSLPPLQCHHFSDSGQAAEGIGQLIQPDDVVLVKGSRVMEMEQIVTALMSEQRTEKKTEKKTEEDI